MADVTKNILLKGMRGRAGNKIFRTIKNKTFSGKIPDMSGILPSKKQMQKRTLFAAAVKYAQSVISDPAQREKFKGGDSSAYHAAIRVYLAMFSPAALEKLSLPPGIKTALKSITLTEPQLRAIAFIYKHKKLTNGYYQKINGVSKPTATRHLQELAGHRIIQFNNGRGAGAHYIIGSFLKKIGSR